MSRAARAVVGAFAVLGAAYVAMLAVAFVGTPGGKRCLSYHVMEVPSPTSAYAATVENNSCMQSGELQTVVYLSSNVGTLRTTSSPVFAAPSALRNAGTYSPMPLRLTWSGDAELHIGFPRGAKVQSRQDRVGEIRIVFSEFDV